VSIPTVHGRELRLSLELPLVLVSDPLAEPGLLPRVKLRSESLVLRAAWSLSLVFLDKVTFLTGVPGTDWVFISESEAASSELCRTLVLWGRCRLPWTEVGKVTVREGVE